jgi:hypothetical protein
MPSTIAGITRVKMTRKAVLRYPMLVFATSEFQARLSMQFKDTWSNNLKNSYSVRDSIELESS